MKQINIDIKSGLRTETEVEETDFIQSAIPNEQLKELRAMAYKDRSDVLYMAHIKYKALGETAKAELLYSEWLNEIKKINLEYAYN